jgi:hypothetical protein
MLFEFEAPEPGGVSGVVVIADIVVDDYDCVFRL